MKKFLLFSLFLLAFLSGCLLYDYKTGVPIKGSEWLGITDLTATLPDEPICKEVNSSTPCYCMFCKNETTSIWQDLKDFFGLDYETSLQEGSCSFEYCNASTYNTVIYDEPDVQARVFMIGQGPSFSSADRANLYCNNTLQLAVKWLTGKNAPPSIPDAQRSSCWLAKNTLPLYIYYTNATHMDKETMENIAASMDGIGPVIITTELFYNSSDDLQLAAVKQQLVAIKSKCKNCLSVLSVRNGDKAALKKILRDPGEYYQGKTLWNLTDMVGFGFRANDYDTCDPYYIFNDNMKFSRMVLRNYSKPSLWLYAGASEGNNSNGTCTFKNESIGVLYQEIFKNIQWMTDSGIIGVNFYEFGDRGGPLPCNGIQGCDFGLALANGTQKHPEINSWAMMCQAYANVTAKSALVFSRNGYGLTCPRIAPRYDMMVFGSTMLNSVQGLDASTLSPLLPDDEGSCGRLCVSGKSLPNSDYYVAGAQSFQESSCGDFPFLDDKADDLGISQLFYRSIIEAESSFEPYRVGCTHISNPNCNYVLQEDGTHVYYDMQTICDVMSDNPNCPRDFTCPDDVRGNPQKPCAFGLSMCTEFPGKYYDQGAIDIRTFLANCGGKNYDPFDPAMSACCGMTKFEAFLSQAKRTITTNWDRLSGVCPNDMQEDEKDWAAYFLAAMYYNYGPGNIKSVDDFVDQRATDGDPCGGYQHYIRYLGAVNQDAADYAQKIFGKYRVAIDQCTGSAITCEKP